jgi:hypothetical protein
LVVDKDLRIGREKHVDRTGLLMEAVTAGSGPFGKLTGNLAKD